VSPVKYEQGFYIPEENIVHRHRRGNFTSDQYPIYDVIRCKRQ
jgi:hypothetical protein